MNQLMSNICVCRTALASPGQLLTTKSSIFDNYSNLFLLLGILLFNVMILFTSLQFMPLDKDENLELNLKITIFKKKKIVPESPSSKTSKDVILLGGEYITIEAHKLVLSGLGPVFKSLL